MHLPSPHSQAPLTQQTPCFVLAAFVLLVIVLVPGLGLKVNGARRWLGAGPLQFQPSELMKLALVLHAASVLAARPKLARSLRAVAAPVIGVGGCAVLLIMAQPDLGTSLVICFTMAAMLVAAIVKQITSEVPRSGWAMISSTAQPPTPITGAATVRRLRASFGLAASTEAACSTSASFISSEGWNCSGPAPSQRRAPLTFSPSPGTRTITSSTNAASTKHGVCCVRGAWEWGDGRCMAARSSPP